MAGAADDDVATRADHGSAHVFLLIDKPGRPKAQLPVRTISTRRPTFRWTRAIRAVASEVRVYGGGTRVLKKTHISARVASWKCTKLLPRNARLTWTVRASNPAGAGAWSHVPRFIVRRAR